MRRNIKWIKSMLFVIFSQVLLIGMLSGCTYFPHGEGATGDRSVEARQDR